MDELFVWVEDGPDKKEGAIATIIPGFLAGPIPLQSRSRAIAMKFREFAEAHRQASGNPVRLLRFRRDSVVEELP
jgi:hypothetical protein